MTLEDRQKKYNDNKNDLGLIIDYERIDVASIMDQIKKKIASQPRPKPAEKTKEEKIIIPPPPRSPWELETATGWKARVKTILLKVMRPFSPLIKLMVFPVYHELRETILKLHHANMRIDYACTRLDHLSAKLDLEVDKLSQILNQRIDRLEIRFEVVDRLREYTKLMHSLAHNLVVEMSKLKIELDTLKIHHRILEKDFRHLEQRERLLEKEIVQ
ncbi:MAG: hypothetical protein N3B16_04280 [Candidatus Aminicenantes bacterium]|nr:hypothetical protein [Candidatus Aminicenantes bacterium]